MITDDVLLYWYSLVRGLHVLYLVHTPTYVYVHVCIMYLVRILTYVRNICSKSLIIRQTNNTLNHQSLAG